jgi:hypothetical protein
LVGVPEDLGNPIIPISEKVEVRRFATDEQVVEVRVVHDIVFGIKPGLEDRHPQGVPPFRHVALI